MNTIIVKHDLKNKTDVEVKQYSQDYMDKLAQTAVFPTLTAGAPAYTTVHNAFSTALGVSDQASQTAQEKTVLKDTARAALEAAITRNGHTVESTPNVTAAMALSLGFAVKGDAAPVGKLPQVQNLSLTTGDKPGAVDGHWDSVWGRKIYEHQHCTGDPAVEVNWKLVSTSSASKTTFDSLTSGSRLWSRVRAKGTKTENDGPWSQPATIIVP